MYRLTGSTVRRRTGVVAALAATVVLVGGPPATASDVRVRHTLFGMHADGAVSFTEIHEGAVRLWDVGTQWQQVETHQNGKRYDWTRLDRMVTDAQEAHAEVTMVVAGTPRFYSKDPWDLPVRRISAYKAFVKALMRRYQNFNGTRGIAAYEVWNESNISTLWTGSLRKMARLTKAMHDVRDRFDKHALVIAPPMVTRLDYQLKGLSEYYHQRVAGRAVWRYVDAVALSLYPLPKYGRRTGVPEDVVRQLRGVKRLLHRAGVPAAKPIWGTEINYGLQSGDRGGTRSAPISDARQAANVMRTYLLMAANGVKRVFWYRYHWPHLPDGGDMANTQLTDPTDLASLTPAGHAYARVQEWMHGTLLGSTGHRPCRTDPHGTYRCVVEDESGKRYIYWNPFHGARVKLPGRVHQRQGVLGATSPVQPRSTLKVGYKPVMVSR
jgi:polysaccharide biosynthesis protein PslG